MKTVWSVVFESKTVTFKKFKCSCGAVMCCTTLLVNMVVIPLVGNVSESLHMEIMTLA